jgi:hypothetical protein
VKRRNDAMAFFGDPIEEIGEAFHIRWTKNFLLFIHLSEDFFFICILAAIIVYFQNSENKKWLTGSKKKKKKKKKKNSDFAEDY